MKWIKPTFFLCALIAAANLSMARAEVEIGKAAPAFTLPGADGKTHSLADGKGKFVVLEWNNHECPFVKKQYSSHTMQALQKKYTTKGVVWLRIVSSAPGKQGYVTAAEATAIAKEEKSAATATLLDPEGKVGRLYNAQTTPHMFIIDPSGKLIYMGAIDDKPSADPADIPGAKNYVSTALDEAFAGKPVSTPATKSYGCSVKY
jgi:peroxiredoxin